MKVKFEILAENYGFWEITDEYDDVPLIEETININDIPDTHPAFGWFECISQSDLCPMWDPTHFKMEVLSVT